MPHRLRLRIAIVDHLLDAGATDAASAIDPSDYHLANGVRPVDFDQAVIELIGLEVVSVATLGGLYLSEEGAKVTGADGAECDDE